MNDRWRKTLEFWGCYVVVPALVAVFMTLLFRWIDGR